MPNDKPQTTNLQDKIADYWADWLIDAIAMSTQNRQFLRDDPQENEVVTEAILLNAKQAILSAMNGKTK